MEIKDLIKDLRTTHGLTQKALSDKLNLSKNIVCEWEKGRCEPKIDSLKTLADIFGVSIDYLVGREDDFGNVTVAGASSELTPEEQTLLSCYRVMTEAEKRAVLDTAKAFVEREIIKNRRA